MGLFNNAAKDAAKIHQTIEYDALRAAWDGFVRLKRKDFQSIHTQATPAWFALFSIINYKGKFKEFEADEVHLLESFTTVQDSYDAIIETLKNHPDHDGFSQTIIASHPNLMFVLPDGHSEQNIVPFLVEQISLYQSMLRDFYAKYQKDIDATLARLKKHDSNATFDPYEEEKI